MNLDSIRYSSMILYKYLPTVDCKLGKFGMQIYAVTESVNANKVG